MTTSIKQGDRVYIRAPFRDPGDENFVWIATDDESEGRVSISPQGTGLFIAPIQTVETAALSLEPVP